MSDRKEVGPTGPHLAAGRTDRVHISNWLSLIIGLMALSATSYSAWTSHASLQLTQRAQQVALFTDFQQDYTEISARFPVRFLDYDFRPPRGSDDYKRLQDYWIFGYAEWFATNRLGPDAFKSLWTNYYAGLMTDALNIPSLRYVLLDMVEGQGSRRDDMRAFLSALTALASKAGQPLIPPASPTPQPARAAPARLQTDRTVP